MVSVSLRKSRTKVFSFSGWMRLSRESVWTAARPDEDLVHVHGVQQRLVETGLELLRHNEHAVIRGAELLGGPAFGEAVHVGLGQRCPRAVIDLPGERDQCTDIVVSLGA